MPYEQLVLTSLETQAAEGRKFSALSALCFLCFCLGASGDFWGRAGHVARRRLPASSSRIQAWAQSMGVGFCTSDQTSRTSRPDLSEAAAGGARRRGRDRTGPAPNQARARRSHAQALHLPAKGTKGPEGEGVVVPQMWTLGI